MTSLIVRFLTYLGERARWVLIAGCIVAFVLPGLAATFRPYLPFLIALVLGLSVARLDFFRIVRRMAKPAKLLELGLISLVLMPVTAIVLLLLSSAVGLPHAFKTSAVLFALAPPISSAAGLCFILGFDARRALEVTLFATLATPLIGPVTLHLIAPDLPAPATIDLVLRLVMMIAGGVGIGVTLRAVIGAQTVEDHKPAFDGASAIGMILFVIPLFDGVAQMVLDDPGLGFLVFVFAIALNLGSNFVVVKFCAFRLPWEVSGAYGLMWGNRTVALYLAALPFDPIFTLFVAWYQFPMYATPLIFRRYKSL